MAIRISIRVELKFETGANAVSDAKAFQAGVREFTYSEDGDALKIWINGRRFIGRGGNWGFPRIDAALPRPGI